MEEHRVKILDTVSVTHDVRLFRVEKPAGYSFKPGQATEVAINKQGLKEKKRPFTFTGLPDDDDLEFIIKTYPSHRGVTDELHQLNKNDELILHDVFGTINYQGKGVFIAGGAGITPFIAIFRNLQIKNEIDDNMLIFGNKTKADIILKEELENLFGEAFINILSDEKAEGYAHGMITEDFLRQHITDFGKKFYVCGPPPMMKTVLKHLSNLGVDESSIVKEEF
jgi:ferredoxin-NADP reductase